MRTQQGWLQRMGRSATTTVVAMSLVFGMAPSAYAAVPTWDVTGSYDVTFSCVTGCAGDYVHRANITSENFTTGNFSGAGFYVADPNYSWDITGNTMGNALTFTMVYNNVLAGYTVNGSGTINENGRMSGTASSSAGETFTWDTGSGVAREIPGNGVQPAECTGTYSNIIHGTNGADTLNGTAGNDLIFGYGGNDTLNGNVGDDCLVAGMGNDKTDGGSGNDTILGQAGSDLRGLDGGSGNDTIYGNGGNDLLEGSSGSDTLTGGAGTDTANGGSGTDSCSAETENSC